MGWLINRFTKTPKFETRQAYNNLISTQWVVFIHSATIKKFLKATECQGYQTNLRLSLQTKTHDWVVFLNIGANTCLKHQHKIIPALHAKAGT